VSVPPDKETTRELSALRQINAAIQHFREGELECAITLAAAAEGQLPEPGATYLFATMKRAVPFSEFDHNLFINWLKHPNEPDDITISGLEATLTLLRAISKFRAVYRHLSPEMKAFLTD
jgi:hypothetical protein